MLAYACIIHKVQELTIPNIVPFLDLVKQKSFNYCQVYAALSRAKSLAGLTIVGGFRKEFLNDHTELVKEYEQLRNDSNALVYNDSHLKQKFISLFSLLTLIWLGFLRIVFSWGISSPFILHEELI